MPIKSEFKVGLFALLSIGVLCYMIFVLSPNTFKENKQASYFTLLDNASGILPKTHVKINGVVVGSVKSVQLHKYGTKIDININTNLNIPKDSEITVKEKGILGDSYLEIIRGVNKEYMTTNSLIPAAKNQYTLSKLVEIAGEIGQNVRIITKPLSETLGSKAGKENISGMFEDLRSITSNIRSILSENKETIKISIEQINQGAKNFNNITRKIDNNLSEIITDLKITTSSLSDVLREENIEKIEKVISQIEKTSVDAGKIAKNINIITSKIESGQGTLGKLINDDQTIIEIEGAVKDMRKIISPAENLHIFVDSHGEYGKSNKAQHFFEIQLKPRPDKYYLIGATDVFESTDEKITEEIDLNDDEESEDSKSSQKTRERVIKRNSLLLNLQYAKRWWFTQLRLGLFQSTGGVAADFFLLKDSLRLTLEVFDWRSSSFRNYAHFKSYMTLTFFDRLYFMIGADDISRKHPLTGKKQEPEYFFGAGVTFFDDELRSLFGLAGAAL